jgi:amino acid adenylation domain-containing protein
MTDPRTLTDLLRIRACTHPERVAFTFLSNSDVVPAHLTFAALENEACQIASAMLALNLRQRPVLLLYPPGLEYLSAFFACLYAGAIAVPLSPPGSNRSLSRLESVLGDAQPALALSTAHLISKLQSGLSESTAKRRLRWLTTDSLTTDEPAGGVSGNHLWPEIRPSDLALLQYTSGSTADPRGVMVTHANLLHNQRAIQRSFGQSADSIVVSWLPVYHDMGLIGAVLQPLYNGSHCILMSPQSFLQRPVRWLQAISTHRATTSGGPNFAYDLCLNKIREEELASLDLSCWEVAFNGAEPVRERTMSEFTERFAPYGFRARAFVPCYGLAEATLLVSAGEVGLQPCVKHVRSAELAVGHVVESHDVEENGNTCRTKLAVRAGAEPETTLVEMLPADRGHSAVRVDGDRALGTRAGAIGVNQRAPDGDRRVTKLVSCGHGLPDQQMIIVDPQQCVRLPDKTIGEVWVAGPSIAQGYWNRAQLSTEVFHSQLTETVPAAGPDPTTIQYLRTGDLGFIDEGHLYLTGRIKNLIIIRGLNHYPQDIEWSAQSSHPLVRTGHGAAFVVTSEDADHVVLVQEVNRRTSISADVAEEVIRAIQRAVSDEHEVALWRVVLVKPHSLPLTTSGKVEHYRCYEQHEAGTLQEVYRWTAGVTGPSDCHTTSEMPAERAVQSRAEIEQWLAGHIASRLGLTAQKLIVHQPLTNYGLDSLLALELSHSIEKQLQVGLSLPSLLGGVSVTELAQHIDRELQARRNGASMRAQEADAGRITYRIPASGQDLRPGRTAVSSVNESALTEAPDSALSLSSQSSASRSAEYPLSPGQQALWFLYQLAPESAAYNISAAVRLITELDVGKLKAAFERLLHRHPVLRNVFRTIEGVPAQQATTQADVWLHEHEAAQWSEQRCQDEMTTEAHRPFDLRQGPVLRISLYHRSATEHVLLLVVHHIVSDFWSLAVMLQELGLFYTAEKSGLDSATERLLAEPALQYRDHVAWLQMQLAGEDGARSQRYWQQQLSGELPVLELPVDRPRPPIPSYRGAAQSFRVDRELTERLKDLSRSNGATLYVTLLAAFEVLLSKYSGQQEVLVGTPASARSRAEMRGAVGYFVNPLVMRGRIRYEENFCQLLRATKEQVLGALAHQEYPFVQLVELLHPAHDPSRAPIFQASFVMQKSPLPDMDGLASIALGEAGESVRIGDLDFESMPLEQRISQFDLTMVMAEVAGGLSASMQYSTDLFEAATIGRMHTHFRNLLKAIADDPDRPLATIPLLSNEEAQQQLRAWNDTKRKYPEDNCLHELFEAQVAKTPNAVAVVFESEQLTYGELNQRANQTAHYLTKLGVKPDSLVGVCLERSVEMVVALLGTLKAGAAYLPLDPEYPKDRLVFMLEDAAVEIILTREDLVGLLPEQRSKIVCLDADSDEIAKEGINNPDSEVGPLNLAYAIYTSGSTGRPKGSLNTHEGICNRLIWMQEQYQLTSADRVLQKTLFSFDVSAWEFFWPLMTGARLVLARPDGHHDTWYLARLIAVQQITTLHFVPSMLEAFLTEQDLEEKCRSVRQVMCSGETLSLALQRRFFSRMKAELHNLYGPTEAAVDVTYWKCLRDFDEVAIPIGRPIANIQIYVLDQFLQPVPVGVSGQLYIGGVGLGRGYLNRPGLTAEKFIPNPFSNSLGTRLFKTGDLARYRLDGIIEFLGRADHQIKIRGFRIEPGEIEATLRRHRAVRDVVVMDQEDGSMGRRLVAYFTAEQDESPSVSDLRGFLAEKLPTYLIPSVFMRLDVFPLLANGKINRLAFPRPGHERPNLDDVVGPRTPLETVLAAMWRKLLNVENVGIHDSFFELGGHSLLATQLISLLQELFPEGFPLLSMFFENPTVAGLSSAVQGHVGEEEVEKIVQALQTLEQLSNEEVEALLNEQEATETSGVIN